MARDPRGCGGQEGRRPPGDGFWGASQGWGGGAARLVWVSGRRAVQCHSLGSHLGEPWPPRGYVAVSGDLCGHHNRGCPWLLCPQRPARACTPGALSKHLMEARSPARMGHRQQIKHGRSVRPELQGQERRSIGQAGLAAHGKSYTRKPFLVLNLAALRERVAGGHHCGPHPGPPRPVWLQGEVSTALGEGVPRGPLPTLHGAGQGC